MKVQQYKVKRPLFNRMTFAIKEDSYVSKDKTQVIEQLRRTITESNGIIVSANQKANYVIFEDGYDANVWQTIGEPDELNRNRVHNKWVEY